MLLGRQQDAVLPSANLAAESAHAYLGGLACPRSALAGGIGDFHGKGLFWQFCWGDPFLDSAAQDGAAEVMIPRLRPVV
jgi:hypothetical protein